MCWRSLRELLTSANRVVGWTGSRFGPGERYALTVVILLQGNNCFIELFGQVNSRTDVLCPVQRSNFVVWEVRDVIFNSDSSLGSKEM